MVNRQINEQQLYANRPIRFEEIVIFMTIAVLTLVDEEIFWTDKSSDGLFDKCEFKTVTFSPPSFSFLSSQPSCLSPCCQTFQKNFPDLITSICSSKCEFRSNFGRLVCLRKIVSKEGQTDGQTQTTKSSD